MATTVPLPDEGVQTCLVVSHYNAWDTDKLIALLDQTAQLDAGVPFHIRVVVNDVTGRMLQLPKRHHAVTVLVRPNSGYNIGAWDLGWRQGRPYRNYLFVQEECRLLRRGWMKAFVRALADPKVGLVGESLVWQRPWAELEATLKRPLNAQFQIDGRPVDHFTCYYENLRRLGIDRGPDGSHLQSLVLAARRDVLEQIGPFPLGADYGAAVTIEIWLSKKVMSMGLQVRQVGWLPFSQVLHPQWAAPWWRRVLGRTVVRWMPSAFRQGLLTRFKRLRASS